MKNSTALKTANTVKSTEVAEIKLNRSLLSVLNKAHKSLEKIKMHEVEKLLPLYVQAGEAFNKLREAFPSNKAFKEACELSPLAYVTRQDRNDYMILAKRWEEIVALREDGTITARTPQTIVKALRALDKQADAPEAEAGEGDDVTTSKEPETLAKIVSDLLARANKNGYDAEAVIAEVLAQSK